MVDWPLASVTFRVTVQLRWPGREGTISCNACPGNAVPAAPTQQTQFKGGVQGKARAKSTGTPAGRQGLT